MIGCKQVVTVLKVLNFDGRSRIYSCLLAWSEVARFLLGDVHLLHTALVQLEVPIFELLEHDFPDLKRISQLDLGLHSTNSYSTVVLVGRGDLTIEVNMVRQHAHIPIKLLKHFDSFTPTDELLRHVVNGQIVLELR